MDAINTSNWPPGTLDVAVLYQLDVCSDNMPFVQWAVDALSSGFDSPALRVLAGLDLDGYPVRAEVFPAFSSSLNELGICLPEPATTARMYVQSVAKAIVSGEIAPQVAAELIHTRVVSPLEHPADLMSWCHVWEGNSSDCSCSLEDKELDKEIMTLASKYAEGTT